MTDTHKENLSFKITCVILYYSNSIVAGGFGDKS